MHLFIYSHYKPYNMEIITIIIVCILAAIVSAIIVRNERRTAAIAAEKESVKLNTELEWMRRKVAEVTGERDREAAAKEALQDDITQLTAKLAEAQTALAEQQKRNETEIAEKERLHKEQLELLSAKFEATSQRMLKEHAEGLSKTNADSVGKLIDPIKEEMRKVSELMDKTKSANDSNTSNLKGALEAMINQTQQLGKDATNLAEALKNKGKVHGDWGEHVLKDILEGSGLREGEEFSMQESFKGKNGNELRPDVIVRCADGKNIIIDSKVSLKDYADALGADNDEERKAAIKANYDSVKKHVNELADKQYPKYVDGSLNYVLMFMPNEGAYVMAMNYDHSLAQEAFRSGIIIVNPTNLMLTLHLVVQTWQNTRQEDNCKRIIKTANDMYDKVIGLVDTCNTLGTQLGTVGRTYQTAMRQLSEGTGNVLRRVENLKDMGVTSTKKVKKSSATQIADNIAPEEQVVTP